MEQAAAAPRRWSSTPPPTAVAQHLSGALLAFLTAKKRPDRKRPEGARSLPRDKGAGRETSPGTLDIEIGGRRKGK